MGKPFFAPAWAMLGCLVLLLWGCSGEPPKGATPLPIVNGPFTQGELTVYELPHGWLVAQDAAFANLVFVPKCPTTGQNGPGTALK